MTRRHNGCRAGGGRRRGMTNEYVKTRLGIQCDERRCVVAVLRWTDLRRREKGGPWVLDEFTVESFRLACDLAREMRFEYRRFCKVVRLKNGRWGLAVGREKRGGWLKHEDHE